jgi:itaconate CoA-transferase
MTGVEPNMQAVPGLGQHTDAILKELGFSAHELAEWHRARII